MSNKRLSEAGTCADESPACRGEATACRMPYAPRPPDSGAGRLDDAEAQAVLAQFTTGNWQRVERLRQGSRVLDERGNTGTARKMLLRMSGRLLLLKQVPWYSDCETHTRAVLVLQQRLAAAGGLAAPLAQARDGHPLAWLPAGSGRKRLFTLQRLVPGTTWDGSAREAEQAGTALARMHRLAAELLPPDAADSVHRLTVFAVARAAILSARRQFGSESGLATSQKAEVTLSRLAGVVDDLESAASRRGYATVSGIVHGDVNPSNLIYQARTGRVTLVDFDNCARDHPAGDVARGLVHFGYFAAPGSDRFADLSSGFRHDVAQALLRGYRRTGPAWPHVSAVLAPVAGCLALELGVLAWLNGWVSDAEAQRLPALPERVVAWATRLVSEVDR
jgi:Phosphotransferase enzyme family